MLVHAKKPHIELEIRGEETTPGKILWVYRDNAGFTIRHLSEKTDIVESHISEMGQLK